MKIRLLLALVLMTISVFGKTGKANCLNKSNNVSITNSSSHWIERDSTWSVVPFSRGLPPLYRNDDGYFSLAMPFNFCFEGQSKDTIIISNNGHVSDKNRGYGAQFLVRGSEKDGFVIAPFWNDIITTDTTSGVVYYKLTNTYLIVEWDSVKSYLDTTLSYNSFQLLLSDGIDTILPPNYNVSFSYKNMEWARSGSINTLVGIGTGNQFDSVSVGVFGLLGNYYDGPSGNIDGVDFLDYNGFLFNTCEEIGRNFILVANDTATKKLCMGESDTLDLQFISPDSGRWNIVSVNLNNINGVGLLNQPLNNSVMMFANGNSNNIGTSYISVTANDNSVPPQSLTAILELIVDSSQKPMITSSVPIVCYPNSYITLASSNAVNNIWSTGATTQSITLNNYVVTGTYYYQVGINGGNCFSDPFLVQFIDVQSPIDLCIVSVDSASGYNSLIWEKSALAIDSFYLYKESTVGGVFDKIATLEANSFSVYIDTTSNPQQKASRYQISFLDSCGYLRPSTLIHQTIHLTISQGIGNTFNLNWDDYEGFPYTSFYILRGTSPGNMSPIDSVQPSLHSYTDLNPPSGSVYYAIEVRKPGGCNPTARLSSQAYTSSRSNIKSSIGIGINELTDIASSIFLSPNPAGESVRINFSIDKPRKIEFQLSDFLGKSVCDPIIHQSQYGINSVSISTSHLTSGIYFLKITSGDSRLTKKVVVDHK